MKRSDYFYASIILGILALVIYGFLNHFGIMVALIAFSSLFNFVVFLIKTKAAVHSAAKNLVDQPIDFYNVGTRTTYYKNEYNKNYTPERRKTVNAN